SARESYERLHQSLAAMSAAIPDAASTASLHASMQPWQALLAPLGGADAPEGRKLLQLGIERTFGGLGDAFGLRPLRDLDDKLREMAVANFDRQRAQLEYVALWAEAWNDGTQALVKDLIARAGRGERIET